MNLLSFGPATEPILLGALNVLIGPNGSGKSNFLEAIRLLHLLPDKDPWSSVLATGGVDEWIWKGSRRGDGSCSLSADLVLPDNNGSRVGDNSEFIRLSLELAKFGSSFRVKREEIGTRDAEGKLSDEQFSRYVRSGTQGKIHLRDLRNGHGPLFFDLHSDRSLLSQLALPGVQASGIGVHLPELFELAELLERFDFHQDWEFGVDCPPRDPQPVGQTIARLEENGYNLAQMLAHYRDNHKAVFEQFEDLVRRFYEPTKRVEIRLISTHLQIAIEEEGGYSTPAYRLSDGMLRWLSMLCVLLNPTPPPITCIDEPELGLHPDVIPTLADLLREAATRTQLVVTTHSCGLVDALSDDPEVVCVCEKVEGSTVIRRLNKEELEGWLEKYSLGQLWTRGQIGGNRW